MRFLLLLVLLFPVWCTSHFMGGDPLNSAFWKAPKYTHQLPPADMTLISAPADGQTFKLLKVDEEDPSDFMVKNPILLPYVKEGESGYKFAADGLRIGVEPYTDRKYQLKDVPEELSGLALLQTEMADKAVLDGRFSILVSSPKPVTVFIAIDERALATYERFGIPGWLQEFSPTEYKINTDDPLMASQGVGYLVFARKASAGRIFLGAPCMSPRQNAMYFAFFGQGQ